MWYLLFGTLELLLLGELVTKRAKAITNMSTLESPSFIKSWTAKVVIVFCRIKAVKMS